MTKKMRGALVPEKKTGSARKTIVYYFRGNVERGTGKPIPYRWHAGYSENSADGSVLYPWMTYTECLADARKRGARAVCRFVTPSNSRPGAPT